MLLLMCLSLLVPQRPKTSVGKLYVRHEVYRDANKEYCYEHVYQLGSTWVEDREISLMEVAMGKCQGAL